MGLIQNIIGIIGDAFQIGQKNGGPRLKNSSGAMEIRNAADSAYAVARALRLQSGAGANDVATRIDVQGRCPNITFSFDGASAPSAGANTAQFGFCHTTGGSFTAGDVVFDDGATALSSYKLPFATTITVGSAVSGTISLIANGLYALESGSWALKGDGGGTETGRLRLIEIPITHSGGDADSTTTLPDGARVTRVDVVVTTPFDGSNPALTVKAQGSTPVTLMASGAIDLTTTNQYTTEEVVQIGSTGAGAVRADLTLSGASAGAATVYVYYTPAPLT